jgi:UDP-N-acetylmuramoyl-L-alanyl-D-glutamate--2,6-diaminopimelate ligase
MVASVPGRFEIVATERNCTVVVDYAHTPDGVAAVIGAARRLSGAGRVIAVVGAGGDRDRGKRPLMGAAAAAADLALITSDNPRSEDPGAIIDEVLAGAAAGPAEVRVEADRRLAIRAALEAAGPDDVVLILGKGHETGQQFADRTLPFDDRVVAREEAAR